MSRWTKMEEEIRRPLRAIGGLQVVVAQATPQTQVLQTYPTVYDHGTLRRMSFLVAGTTICGEIYTCHYYSTLFSTGSVGCGNLSNVSIRYKKIVLFFYSILIVVCAFDQRRNVAYLGQAVKDQTATHLQAHFGTMCKNSEFTFLTGLSFSCACMCMCTMCIVTKDQFRQLEGTTKNWLHYCDWINKDETIC